MAKHAVIGTGTAPAKVILDGLKEAVEEGDSLVVPWYGNPADGSGHESVYRFIKDSEVEVQVLYSEEGAIPAALRNWDNVTAVKTRNPIEKALDELNSDSAVLFLWDDDKPEQIEEVFEHDENLTVLELTNGLSPIVVDDNSPLEVPTPAPVEEPEEEVKMLTREEVEIMTAAAAKEYGMKRGCEAKTKSGIIEELFGPEPQPVEDESPPVEASKDLTEVLDASNKVEYFTWLLNNFYDSDRNGFDAEMASLALSQAALWLEKALSK